MSDRAFNPSQPLVNEDGTPVYEFQDFLTEVDDAIQDAELVSVWGGIGGSISDQSDLIGGGGILDSLITESNVAQHEASLLIGTTQLTGNMPDARIVVTNVTQHEGALSIAFTQVTGTLADAQVTSGNVTQHEGDLTLTASQVASGAFADARISESSVTQHEGALSVAFTQVTGTLADAQVTSSNVTQHEGDLTVAWSQITSPEYVAPTVRDEATDPYTLVIGDADAVLRFTTSGAAVTIPQDVSVNFPTGTEVTIRQAGTGTLVLTTTGLTINGTLPTWAQHEEVTLRKVGADEWDVV